MRFPYLATTGADARLPPIVRDLPMPRPRPPLDTILDTVAGRLTGTAAEPDPKAQLDHIAELSRNARAT